MHLQFSAGKFAEPIDFPPRPFGLRRRRPYTIFELFRSSGPRMINERLTKVPVSLPHTGKIYVRIMDHLKMALTLTHVRLSLLPIDWGTKKTDFCLTNLKSQQPKQKNKEAKLVS